VRGAKSAKTEERSFLAGFLAVRGVFAEKTFAIFKGYVAIAEKNSCVRFIFVIL